MNRICKCGKTIPENRNSTIQSKLCPSCTFKQAVQKRKFYKAKETAISGDKRKKKRTPKQIAMASADMWFSRYIRISHSVDGAFCKCYTCGKPYGIKNIDCGHYVNRGHKTVRFNENNARPQCKRCNRFNSGKHTEFGIKLSKEIGAEEVDNLRQLSLFPGEDNELFYREQADIFKKKYKEYIEKHGIVDWFK